MTDVLTKKGRRKLRQRLRRDHHYRDLARRMLRKYLPVIERREGKRARRQRQRPDRVQHEFVYVKNAYTPVRWRTSKKNNARGRGRGYRLRADRGYCRCGWGKNRPCTKAAWRRHHSRTVKEAS